MISIILRSTAQCVPQEEEAGRGESEVQPLIQDQGHVSHQVNILTVMMMRMVTMMMVLMLPSPSSRTKDMSLTS